jgi:uncharacterized protein (DUF433 family)
LTIRSAAGILSVEVTTMELAPRISATPDVRFGRPVITGTRVPVDVVLTQLANGLTADEVAREYGIAREDVLAALAYAARQVAEEDIRAVG